MAFVVSQPKKIYNEDVQYSTSVSEAFGGKLGSSLNYILDNFDVYVFGIEGNPYSGLSSYPAQVGSVENMRSNCVITDIKISNEISGTSGVTEFKIERQLAAGGSWDNIFSVNCSINNTAADGLIFNMNGSAPSNVTLPVLSISSFSQNDKLRFTLITAATGADNLEVHVIMRPTA